MKIDMKIYNYYLLGLCFITLIIFSCYISNFYKESFEALPSSLNESFCKSYTGNKLNEKCNSLTFKNCNEMSCCIFEKGGKCVAGNEDGALFNTDENGNTKKTPYYFKEKCYGC